MNDNNLQKLIDQLRANGVISYRGPIEPGFGCSSPGVELSLDPNWSPPRTAPGPSGPRLEPQEPEPRGDDGLTKAQHRDWYGSTGG